MPRDRVRDRPARAMAMGDNTNGEPRKAGNEIMVGVNRYDVPTEPWFLHESAQKPRVTSGI